MDFRLLLSSDWSLLSITVMKAYTVSESLTQGSFKLWLTDVVFKSSTELLLA